MEKRIFPPASVIPTSMRPSVRPSVRPERPRTKGQKDYWTTDHGTTELRDDRIRDRSQRSVMAGAQSVVLATGTNGKLWEKVGISGKNWEIVIQEWEIVGKNGKFWEV